MTPVELGRTSVYGKLSTRSGSCRDTTLFNVNPGAELFGGLQMAIDDLVHQSVRPRQHEPHARCLFINIYAVACPGHTHLQRCSSGVGSSSRTRSAPVRMHELPATTW